MKVGDLVQVTHPNGAGAGNWWVPTGTLGIVLQVFGDRFNKGAGYEEIEVAAASIGKGYAFYEVSWKVVTP